MGWAGGGIPPPPASPHGCFPSGCPRMAEKPGAVRLRGCFGPPWFCGALSIPYGHLHPCQLHVLHSSHESRARRRAPHPARGLQSHQTTAAPRWASSPPRRPGGPKSQTLPNTCLCSQQGLKDGDELRVGPVNGAAVAPGSVWGLQGGAAHPDRAVGWKTPSCAAGHRALTGAALVPRPPWGTGAAVGRCCWGSRESSGPPCGLYHLQGVPVPKLPLLAAWHRCPQPFRPAVPPLSPSPAAGAFLSPIHPWWPQVPPPSPPPLTHSCHHVPRCHPGGLSVPSRCQHPVPHAEEAGPEEGFLGD